MYGILTVLNSYRGANYYSSRFLHRDIRPRPQHSPESSQGRQPLLPTAYCLIPMNVYDFDNTILRGDSSTLFFFWCLWRTPRMWADLPAQALNGLMFLLKIKPKQAFKARMFGYLSFIDVDRQVADFWDKNLIRVKDWYIRQHRDDDVVISASPEFLIRPACQMLGITRVMGSRVDPHTGRFDGLNCHGREKVRRFREVYPTAIVENFYSDSRSDDPMAAIARQAWLVKGERVVPHAVQREG